MDEEQATKITVMVHVGQGRKPPAEHYDLWFAALRRSPFEIARQAASELLLDCEGLINPAMVRHRITAIARARLREAPQPLPPPAVRDDPQAYEQFYREWQQSLLGGAEPKVAERTALAAVGVDVADLVVRDRPVPPIPKGVLSVERGPRGGVAGADGGSTGTVLEGVVVGDDEGPGSDRDDPLF